MFHPKGSLAFRFDNASGPKTIATTRFYTLCSPTSEMNAFLKWAGSKRKLIPTLTALMPPAFDRYVEPFAGSACLFFASDPESALLADINEELVDTYLQIRDNVEGVIRAISKIPVDKSTYYEMRSLEPKKLRPAKRAARFIYLNRLCFNGLYRTNRAGRFNVPYSGNRSGNLPPPARLRDCSRALAAAEIASLPFEQTLAKTKAGDFVYLDPPYCIASRRVFNEYSNASFDQLQLKTLRAGLEDLDRRNIPFLVSYGFSREASLLGKGFNLHHTFVNRQIAGFAGNRRRARELMITNY